MYKAFSIIIISLALFLLSSCQYRSSFSLLTDGDVKFWEYQGTPCSYLSFSSKDSTMAEYLSGFRRIPLNAFDAVHGTHFTISDSDIIRYWKGKTGTIIIDTITIVSVSRKRLSLRYKSLGNVVSFKYIKLSSAE